jgi:hypothetical protein
MVYNRKGLPFSLAAPSFILVNEQLAMIFQLSYHPNSMVIGRK